MIENLKRKIFIKWKFFCHGNNYINLDCFGNEYYLTNGIFVIHISKEAKYKFGFIPVQRREQEPIQFNNGFYVMTTRWPNYQFIDDPDILNFIFDFDLTSKRSLHKELRRRMKVDLSPKGLPGNYSFDQTYHDSKAVAS